ncbi:hypothetical protein PG991_001012 [Apiospora marii]|uniref:Uncharacterized protein n=1 Tax=Apiospora marii TaxID=335849 RepID=A0ABR1STJ9_9PEZI
MSGSDLRFEDSADLCESGTGSLYDVTSFDGESIDSNEDNGPCVPLPEEQSAQIDTLRELLSAQSTTHANEVAKLKQDLLKAHTFIHDKSNDLTREYERRLQQTKAEHDAQFGGLVQKYREAGRQLAAAQSQTQGIFQDLTDERLTQKVLILRQSIKAFAQLFPAQSVYDGNRVEILRWSAHETKQINLRGGHPLLGEKMPVTPVSLQAYIWHLIVERVFGCFLWAGLEAKGLQHMLSRFDENRRTCDAQAIRKMKIWKATTASLLLGPAPSQNEMTGNDDAARQIHHEICRLCGVAFMRRLFAGYGLQDQDRYRRHAYHILEQAVKLDLEISKQGAGVHWDFFGDKGRLISFTASLPIITAPGLTKLGNSNGDHFDRGRRVLLEAEEESAFDGTGPVRSGDIQRMPL